MTKATSFRLSDEAIAQLAALAERFKKSQAAILEHLIKDRSSVSDQAKNKARRDKAWKAHCEWVAGVEEKDERAKYLFVSGYNRGWIDFQTRHGENDFIIPAPDETKE